VVCASGDSLNKNVYYKRWEGARTERVGTGGGGRGCFFTHKIGEGGTAKVMSERYKRGTLAQQKERKWLEELGPFMKDAVGKRKKRKNRGPNRKWEPRPQKEELRHRQ